MRNLTDILADLEPVLGPLSGEVTPLEGGITNRNFRVRLGASDYVVRRHGKRTGMLGIDRVAERLASEAAARLGIAPQVAAAFEDGLVTRFIDCAAVGSGGAAERVEDVACALRAFHDCGVSLPARFWVPDLLAAYAGIVTRSGRELPPAYAETVTAARRIVAAVPLDLARPCHNDLLPGNIILAHDGGRIMIVDWEYAGMGHPFFDLGNLSVNNAFGAAEDDRLLAAYNGQPPTDRHRARLQLMRVLSDAREAAWGVVQSGISELEFDFEGYGQRHFERLLAVSRQPEFEEWLASA